MYTDTVDGLLCYLALLKIPEVFGVPRRFFLVPLFILLYYQVGRTGMSDHFCVT